MSENKIMSINWRELISPNKVDFSGNSFYGKFVCEPFERGFGLTIGNALRRVILSSIYGAAIVSVKFDSVPHEFSAIDGVLEDVSEIILNLKGIRLRMVDTSKPRTITLNKQGVSDVTAADIISEDGRVEVLNPEHHIATITSENASLDMIMTVNIGKGYSLSEANKDPNAPVNTIPIDAPFSPIKRVNYNITNARVGQKTDYEKLTFEVWTDGTVFPRDAIAYAAKIIKEQISIFINFDENKVVVEQKEQKEQKELKFNHNLLKDVNELELSVRSANCLKSADINKIYELVVKTENEMLKTKNFGRKSLNEIKEILESMELNLGMSLDDFKIPEEDEIEE
ncbi:MAG: DNA-directed RNA polymerase subunit alpha [Deltaproteobacteria bacterium]|nr:DNA-directed RNA polymerase subunit alpha [Deltaproteobacteria bacterium]